MRRYKRMEEDMWHQPEDARSMSSRLDTQSLSSRSNVGARARRQAHQSPHHSLSRAFGEHVRRAYNRYEQDHQRGRGDPEIRNRGRRSYDSDGRPRGERRYERRERRPGEEDPRRRRHRRHRRDDRHRRDRSRDRHHRERDRSDFEHNFNARMQRWMNGSNEPMYGGY